MKTPIPDLHAQGHGPARNPARSAIPVGRGLVRAACVGLVCAVIGLAAHLARRAVAASEPIDIDQLTAYAAFLLVAAAAPVVVALLSHRLSVPVPGAAGERRPSWLSPVAACVLLSIGVSVTALLTYELAEDIVVRSMQHRLQAVAALKASSVQAWLEDAREDIVLWVDNPEFFKGLAEWRANGANAEGSRQRLLDYMKRLSKTSHYAEISLRDGSTGALLLTTTRDADTPEVRRLAILAASSTEPLLEDFHVDPSREGDPSLFVGLFAAAAPLGETAQAVVHVNIDPRRGLFRLIDQWPGASKTAEVVLARTEGDSMVELNDSGPEVRTPRRPLPRLRPASPIATALAARRGGAFRGLDHRNQPVLAYAAPVPKTPWFVIAKIDEAEALAELNRTALLAASIVGALLLLAAWWWVERHRHDIVEQRYLSERAEHAQRTAELSRRVVSVQEEERRRWSSELHDRTAANLAAINLNLKAIAKSIPSRGPRDEELLGETSALIVDTVASIREFCGTLRPAILDYAGLVPAIETILRQFSRRTGARARLVHSGFSGRHAGEVESVLFRIAQEALMNCAKHARANEVLIELRAVDGRLSLTIEDDGVGFDPADLGRSKQGIGQGLLNMRERAEFVGGLLIIHSAPGRGTKISLETTLT